MAHQIRFASFIGLLTMSIVAQAATFTVTLHPSQDNTIIQVANPSPTNQLSNGLGDIFVGRTNQDGTNGPAVTSIRRGLVEFNVAGSIPAGATITGVTLALQDVMGLNGNQTTTLHDVLDSWGQGTSFFAGGVGAPATQNDATWLYRFFNASNPSASTPWTTPGGDYSSTVSGSQSVGTSFGAGHVFAWVGTSTSNSQMIADVQNWLDNPSSNFGWAILGNESVGQTAKRFAGEFSANGTPPATDNTPPALTITYTVPEPGAGSLLAVALFCIGVWSVVGNRIGREARVR